MRYCSATAFAHVWGCFGEGIGLLGFIAWLLRANQLTMLLVGLVQFIFPLVCLQPLRGFDLLLTSFV
jgi:hypothetical protein